MASLPDRLRVRAAQNIDDMVQPKSESAFRVDAMDAGEKFLRRNRAVERLARGEAIVAAVTRWLVYVSSPKYRSKVARRHSRVSA